VKPILVAILVAVFTITAHAQVSDSLQACIQTALANNPEIAVAQRKWEAALQKIPQARALDDPMVGVDVERFGTTRFDTFTDNEWMISQTVPWFGKRGLRGGVETGAATKAEMDWRMKKLDIVAMVKQAYYDLWQAQRELEVNGRNQQLLRQFVEAARTRYETGSASQSDLIRAQNALAKLAEDRVDRVRQQQQALTDLNQLLRRAPETPVDIGPEVTAPVLELGVTLEQLQAAAVDRPELLGVREGSVRSAEAALALAKKSYYPDVQFRIEARQLNGQSGIQEYDTGVFINFPWLNHGKYKAAIAEARANLDASHDELDVMRARTAAEVKKLYDGVHTMHHHYDLYTERLIPQQRLAVESARAAYETGAGGFLDLLDADRTLFDLEMQNLHHAAEFQRLLASLERMAGGRLPLPPVKEKK
jgi:cobalt-zinc-cadmium efflux system outer membrane protein